MPESDPTHRPPGHRLFAQYAHAPNALGYCGPTASAALAAAATGSPPVAAALEVAAAARRFSGAWPYQELLAAMLGIDDALDPTVVRGYWTGNPETASVDREQFGRKLIDLLAPQAGHYWAHLTDELLPEAAPSHAFHVLGVYPWSRLLGRGPEPLHVLESCRIAWAQVDDVLADELVVTGPQLEFDGGLRLTEPRTRRVRYRLDGQPFVDHVAPGDSVAVHWDFACDRLTASQVEGLVSQTEYQLTAMAPRLAAQL